MNSAASTTVEAPQQAAGRQAEGILCGLLAEFDSPDALKDAARRTFEAGYQKFDVHSPYPIHGMEAAAGIRRTRLPWIVFCCGLAGCMTGLLLQWWTNATNPLEYPQVPTFLQGYNYLVSGKPYFSLPANIPVIFELTILFSAFGAVFGMLIANNLPLFYNPKFRVARFAKVSDDGFFISIDATDPRFNEARTREFLQQLGAVAVERVVDPPGGDETPRWLRPTAITVVLLMLTSLAWIAVARNNKTTEPRIHPIQDMDNQPRFKAQQANPIFADLRAMRPPVEGTVARGELRDDDHYYRGLVDGKFATTFPPQIDLTVDFVRRGQQRFNIYCAPCHGVDGSGNGPVNQRVLTRQLPGTWVPAANLHEQQYRERPLGHLFNTITHGIRTMPPYGDQIPVRDRWAIVAYVKALQRSTQATLEDVPPEKRAELEGR